MTAVSFAMNPNRRRYQPRNTAFAKSPAPHVLRKRTAAEAAQSASALSSLSGAKYLGFGDPFAVGANALPAALCWHACLTHMGQQWFCLCPWHCACLEVQHRILASCAEQVGGLWGVPATRLLPAPEMAPLAEARASEDELARSMDIAIGERAA